MYWKRILHRSSLHTFSSADLFSSWYFLSSILSLDLFFSVCFSALAYCSVTHASPGTSTAVGSYMKYLCHLCVCVRPIAWVWAVCMPHHTYSQWTENPIKFCPSHLFIILSSPLSRFSVLIRSRGGKQRMNESHYLSRPSCRSLLYDKLKPVMITGGAN